MHQLHATALCKRLPIVHYAQVGLWRRPSGDLIRRMGDSARRARFLSFVVVSLFTTTALGQGQLTRIYGPQDQDVPTPTFVPMTGNKDATALETIQSFLTAASATTWNGLQATGSFALAGSQQATPEGATLTISGGDDFRLDLTTSSGTRSIRIYGQYEEIQESSGTRHSVPFLAAQAGLLAFPKLLASEFSVSGPTVLDDGMVTVSGEALHRLTIEQPLYPTESKPTSNDTNVMDLYFDATTHLLIKSAVAVPIRWYDRERYIEVTTYGNYHAANGVLIPFTCSQTIDGQPQWTLQLSSVQSLPSLNNSYFHF